MTRNSGVLILQAVRDLVEERGSVAFTFEEVAKRAGVSRQTVYTHFPDRASLFVALADQTRVDLDATALSAAVLEAPTARDALSATVDFHMAFTMRILALYRAIEIERARDPAIAAAFERRDVGRVRIVRHVMTRLKAEGQLDPAWSIEAATELMDALLSASLASELHEHRGWSLDEFRDRLLFTLRRTFLVDYHQPQRTKP
jgi:AcrR family transcriptional regulator